MSKPETKNAVPPEAHMTEEMERYLERLERTRHHDLPDAAEWEATALASRNAVEAWEAAAERSDDLAEGES